MAGRDPQSAAPQHHGIKAPKPATRDPRPANRSRLLAGRLAAIRRPQSANCKPLLAAGGCTRTAIRSVKASRQHSTKAL